VISSFGFVRFSSRFIKSCFRFAQQSEVCAVGPTTSCQTSPTFALPSPAAELPPDTSSVYEQSGAEGVVCGAEKVGEPLSDREMIH
jgi:hypothetical protein